MMYDKDGNALVGLQTRATKDYSPTQLGLNAVTLPAAGTWIQGNWMDCRGYEKLVVMVNCNKTYRIAVELSMDGTTCHGSLHEVDMPQATTGDVFTNAGAQGIYTGGKTAWAVAPYLRVSAKTTSGLDATFTARAHLQA